MLHQGFRELRYSDSYLLVAAQSAKSEITIGTA